MRTSEGFGIITRLIGLWIVILAPALVLLVLDLREDRATARAEAEETIAGEARGVARVYGAVVEEAHRFLEAVAMIPQVQALSPEGCELIDGIGALNRRYLGLAVVNPTGAYHCQTIIREGETSINLADREWFRVPLTTGRPGSQAIPLGRLSRQPSIAVGQPIRDSAGRTIGVVGAGIDLRTAGVLLSGSNLPAGHVVELLGPGGAVLVRSPGTVADRERAAEPLRALQASGETERRGTLETPSGTFLAAVAPVPGVPGLVAAVRVEEEALLAEADALFVRNLTALAVLALLSVAGAWFAARRLVADPLSEVSRAANVLATGDLAARTGIERGPSEVRALGAAFNRMAQSLEDRDRELGATYAALESSQERLAHAEKLEAVGQLTGGVAHDFNNLLTVIRGNLELVGEDGMPAESRALLEEAYRAAVNGTELVTSLLAFARRQPLTPGVVDLSETVSRMGDLLDRTLGDSIEVELLCAEPGPRCNVDGGALQTVLLNLTLNARDAMPKGGKLTVETATVALDGDVAEVNPGRYAMLRVTDTGVGMPDEVARRAVEPFFTTKPRGRGTGLGLSGAYGFAHQSGGTLVIETEEGRGTTVRVYLPVTSKSPHPTGLDD